MDCASEQEWEKGGQGESNSAGAGTQLYLRPGTCLLILLGVDLGVPLALRGVRGGGQEG